MIRTHYHVMAGTVGCLPEGNELFETKHDAEAYARAEAADYREAGVKVSGSVKHGYAIDPINYLEVVSCDAAECREYEYGA